MKILYWIITKENQFSSFVLYVIIIYGKTKKGYIMHEIIYNHNDLSENDIDSSVIRTKALIINSKNEILLGYSYHTYQFPGGHLKEGENILECLQREIEEETGIFISGELNPFLKRVEYHVNYLNTDRNKKIIIYYYLIYTNEQPQLDATHLDEQEQAGDFKLLYVPLEKVDDLLQKSIPDNPINEIIVREMQDVLKYYREYL